MLESEEKWRSRLAGWEQRKKAASGGNVLSKSERHAIHEAVPVFGYSDLPFYTSTLETQLLKTKECYADTPPIVRIEQQRLDSVRGTSQTEVDASRE